MPIILATKLKGLNKRKKVKRTPQAKCTVSICPPEGGMLIGETRGQAGNFSLPM